MTQWGLDTLFNPAKRHMDEEKLRQQSTRAEVGDNSGGKRIDLESGKVTIKRTDDPAEDDSSTDSAASASSTASSSGSSSRLPSGPAPSAKPAKVPSAAAVRAAKRRGREPR